jgi:hypothetical protein
VYNLIDKFDLSGDDGASQSIGESGKLSPRGAVALLRDLLKLHDSSFDELSISDLAKLQCAATQDGHFVWASRQEIMALGDKLTPCDPEDMAAPLKRTLSSASTVSTDTSISSTAASLPSEDSSLRLRLSVASITGLSAWDWRRVYCKWQLLHTPSGASPVAASSTPHHADASIAPSWPAVEFVVAGVSTEAMLRECTLIVRVKRPSRCLGIVKYVHRAKAFVCLDDHQLSLIPHDVYFVLRVVAEGAVQLGEALPTHQAVDPRTGTVTVQIPLGKGTPASRVVTIQLAT